MSLVFLKNDDQSRDNDVGTTDDHLLPWRWTNYFTNPIKIPRNAQVCYIKSSVQQPETNFIDTTEFYVLNGNTLLNPVIALPKVGGFVKSWKTVFADMGRLCNQYGADNNFNNATKIQDNYKGVSQVMYGVSDALVPGGLGGIEGYNFLITSGNKVNIRLRQRDCDDTQNQSYNSGGYNGSGGINVLNINPANIDYDFVKLNSPYFNNGGSGVHFVGLVSRSNPNELGLSLPTFTNWYDVGWTFVQTNDPGYGVGGGNPNGYTAFNTGRVDSGKGHYGMVYSRTPIKQWITDGSQTPNSPVGHQFPVNGYVVKSLRTLPQAFGNTDYPDPNGSGYAGPYVGGFDSFGIQSINQIECMPTATSLAESQAAYVANMDMNTADNPFVPAGGYVPRYLIGCDIEIRDVMGAGAAPYLSVKVLNHDAPQGSSQYTQVAEVDLTAVAQANNVTINAFLSGITPGRTPARLNVRFRWTTPYCFAVEYCLNYDSAVDEPYLPGVAGGDPMAEWVLLYDMNNDAEFGAKGGYLLPGWYGDLTLVEYPVGNLNYPLRKGWFDYRQSYRPRQNQAIYLDGDMPLLDNQPYYQGRELQNLRPVVINDGGASPIVTLPRYVGVEPEKFVNDATLDTNGCSEKQCTLVLNPITNPGKLGEVLNLLGDEYFYFNNPDTHIGDQIGIEGAPNPLNTNILGGAEDYEVYGLDGGHSIHLSERVNSLHIQLENLPIQSQNGVKSTQNKTIAVVATQDALTTNDPLNSNNIYNDEAHNHNWIDLNNYSELNLSQISVKITYDDNTEAKSLVNRSDVTIMFRQKPSNPNPDATALPDNITNLMGFNR